MSRDEMYEGWQKGEHAQNFDSWSKLDKGRLKKTYESFNEIRLFIENKNDIKGKTFVEVGCATGELYRYLKTFHPEFQYAGYDISRSAIERAKKKYPEGNFFVCDENLTGISQEKPAILFARDVVLHQLNPFEFLLKLVSIPLEAAILRLRTRDVGKTVLDTEYSCQYYLGTWQPYMVLNVDEMVVAISKNINFKKLILAKNYQPLGGHGVRFLPKDCYLPETGTAETAIYLELASQKITNPEIISLSIKDSIPEYSTIDRGLDIIRQLLFKR